MDLLNEIITGLRAAMDKPDVAWSGLGTYVVSVFLGLAGAGSLWLLARFFKKKTSSDAQKTDDWFSRNQDKLLERLKTDLKDRRESFLLGQNTLDLGKKLSPDAVDRPYSRQNTIDYTLERDGKVIETTDQPITELFQHQDVGQRLAILGKPGSGKTVCLLALVELLLEQASGDIRKPLPIIFECSEWDGRERRELLPWMAWQLNRKYDIKEDIARQMLEERDVLPLFDGLDELAAEKQGDFVRLFNALPIDRPQVVCCRVREYGQLQENSGVRLALKNAVILQDISRPRLKGHLLRQGLDELWLMLEQSENEATPSPVEDGQEQEQPQSLLELARRPLFLGIMIGVAEKLRKGFKRRQGESWEDLLWRLYLNDCLAPRTPLPNQEPDEHDRKYAQAPSLHWLHCLAKWMQAEDKVALQIDELQPSMLKRYWPIGSLYVIVYGLFFGLTGWLFKGPVRNASDGILLGLEVGLFFLLFFMKTTLITLNAKLIRCLTRYLLIVMPLTCLGVLLFALFRTENRELRQMLAVMLAVGLFAALFDGLLKGLKSINSQVGKSIHLKELLSDILRSSLLLFPVLTFISMIIFSLVMLAAKQAGLDVDHFLEANFLYSVLLGTAVSSFLFLSINEILQRCLLRFCLWEEGQLPLRLIPWLNTMHQRKVFQRVGGSYHFLHKQLRDYLAKQQSTRFDQKEKTGS
ncbi:MAG: hypothetical protein D3915_08950 [Candidatus Electrothrix sp. AU1_5]|nr:hypothetical protein [Candidatus Electrothrix gigas]